MIQALWIPGWQPATLNELLRHRMAAAKLKAKDAEIVGRAALAHGATKANGPRRVDMHLIVGTGKRKCDPDAWWKSTLDALAKCGMLLDDTPRLCRTGHVTYSRAEDDFVGTIILLEDLP